MTLYTGVRLNNSTEVLVDIEEAGGAALSTGLGLAGIPIWNIVRNPLLSKAPYLGRGMIHKVFALSKDRIENQRTFLSLFDELPAPAPGNSLRQFSMPDFFDQNSAGSDTHFQFNNWTIDNSGAGTTRRIHAAIPWESWRTMRTATGVFTLPKGLCRR